MGIAGIFGPWPPLVDWDCAVPRVYDRECLPPMSIYLSMAAIFIAQAYGIDLSIGQQLSLLAVLMVTSKGAAGVTGA